MHRASRIVSCRFPPFLRSSPVARSTNTLSRGQQICTRLSSTDFTSAAKDKVLKDGANVPKNNFSSVRPLPPPPPRQKGAPSIINTRDIEEYIQPLYSRGWGLSPILPNGNGIAVLRKRFDFASAEALKTFLAGLAEYEMKKQVRFRSSRRYYGPHPDKTNTTSCCRFPGPSAPRNEECDRGSTSRRPRQHVDARRTRAECGRAG